MSKKSYTIKEANQAAKTLGFQNAQLMLEHFKAKVMADGLFEALAFDFAFEGFLATASASFPDAVKQRIQLCKTRQEVAEVLRFAGYGAHIGGHHVAADWCGRRFCVISNKALPDFN